MARHLDQRPHQLALLARDRSCRARGRGRSPGRRARESWQVNALVEATPISGPASVGSTTSDSRAMVEVRTLTIGGDALALAPCSSAASPACRRSRPTARRTATSPPLRQRRLAVAELGGDVDLDGHARIALEPVLADEAGVVGGAAGRDGDARQMLAGSTPRSGRSTRASGHVDVVGQRVADDLGLLVDLLGHEVAVVALVDQQRAGHRLDRAARSTRLPLRSKISAPVAAQHRPVALLQIGDGVGERARARWRRSPDTSRPCRGRWPAGCPGARRSSGRRAPAKMMASAKAPCRRAERAPARPRPGPCALSQLVGDEVHDRLGVGVGLEHVALGARAPSCSSRKFSMMPLWTTATRSFMCGWALRSVGRAVRRPARVADAGVALQRLAASRRSFEVLELALGAAALEVAVLDGGDAGRSHSRDTRAAAARRRGRSRPAFCPRMPTMPHMRPNPCSLRRYQYC